MIYTTADIFLSKDLDALIAEAQVPIQRMEEEYAKAKKEWTEKINQAQRASQTLNMSVDKLEVLGKRVER